MHARAKLDPVVGRDTEIQRVIPDSLPPDEKQPRPDWRACVGQDRHRGGAGKKIAMGDVPDELLDKRILSNGPLGMVAGTKYRGEFEERIKKRRWMR